MLTRLKFPAVVFLCFLLTGCQSTGGYYLGALADGEGDPIVVSTACQQAQLWEDLYLTIDSELGTFEGQQRLSGNLAFSEHSQGMYGRVVSLDLRVFLLDEDNRVVGYRSVLRFLGRSTWDQIPFHVVLPDTAEVVAYTFGYEATFADLADSVSTWNLPSRQR